MAVPQKHLIIIGGGSSAHSAAIKAASLNARSTVINAGLPQGGTCVNVGCVPSKFLIRSAEKQQHPTFPQLIQQKRKLVEGLREAKYVKVLDSLRDVKYVTGCAELVVQNEGVDAQHGWCVKVNGETLRGDAVVVATGSTNSIPPIAGLDGTPYLTHESLYELDQQPKSLLVIGGGYIALENAQMMSRLGTSVTVLQRGKHILSTESEELACSLERYLQAEGLRIETEVGITDVTHDSQDGFHVRCTVKGVEQTIQATHLLVATGRRANTQFLSSVIKRNEQGFIHVDRQLRTSVPGVYAVGDVTGQHLYVYTAAYDGQIAASNALGGIPQQVNYEPLPWVIFTDPQVAGVGSDEQQAGDRGIEVDSGTIHLRDVPRFQVALEDRGYLTLFRNRKSRKIVGARAIGPECGELMMLVAVAMKQDMTSDQLVQQFYPYLTMSETVKLAALAFDTSVDKLSCCAT